MNRSQHSVIDPAYYEAHDFSEEMLAAAKRGEMLRPGPGRLAYHQ